MLCNACSDWKPPRFKKWGDFLNVRPMLENAPATTVQYKKGHRPQQVLRAEPAKALT